MSETRKLAAILAADVVGYSRLAGVDEDRTLARLRALRSDLIDPTIAVYHGRVVKRTGDGSLIEFRSVVDAVRCAIEVQNGMIERNAGLPPDRRIEFRVGIHLGDVVEESDGDLMGDGVNIAARLEGIAKPGTICLSEDAYRQVKGRLDLAVTDLGSTPLKNIAEPIHVYSVEVGRPALAKPTKPAAPAEPAHLSIVVLPFTNLSGDPSQDYFADGVTENLTTDLSRIRNGFVIARSTAFTFKGKSVGAKEIGKELGVRYVLEGSVQRDQDRVRVNAQLIDAESGAHLWADRFEENVADLFKLQDQVVARLANTLGYHLIKAEAEKGARSKNPDAIDLTMRGWALWYRTARQRIKDDNNAARALFEQALKVDPNEAEALTGEAWTYFSEYNFGWGNSETDYDAKILRQADRAIALDRNLAHAYSVKSRYLWMSHRPKEALGVAEAGLAVNPNVAGLYMARAGAEFALGRFEQAKSDVQQAMRLSPRDPHILSWQLVSGDAELAVGHTKAAIDQYQKIFDGGDRSYWVYANLAAAYALEGRMEEAKSALAEARRVNPRLTVNWFRTHAYDQPTKWKGLRKAGLPEE
jgi:adenylate cyclase